MAGFRTTVYVKTNNGEVKRKTVRANSKRELDKKVNAIKAEANKGKDVYTAARFGDWAEKWYKETKLNHKLSESRLTVIQSTIKHLNRYFEHTQLKDIKLSMFQNMINELAKNNPNTNKPASADLLIKIKNNAQSIFEYASANDIAYVPAFFKLVTIPKETVSEHEDKRRALTEQEQLYVIDTPHRAQLPAMIMMFSGLRRAECLALEWTDINLKRRYIDVHQTLEFGKNQGKVKKGGKTKKASRIVPIPPILVDYLTDYKEKHNIKSGVVCLNASGEEHTKSSWDKTWKSYMLDLNLKYGYDSKISKYNPKIKASELPFRIEQFTPHFLRHTFATMLYLQDVDVVKAMRILGHTKISTTVDIYTDFQTLQKEKLSKDYLKKLKTDYKINVS